MKLSVIPLNHRAIYDKIYNTTNSCGEISTVVVEKKLKQITSSVEFVLLTYESPDFFRLLYAVA